MNIDEERKAFEAVILPTGLFKAVEWNGEGYTMSGGPCMTQDYFEVWCKAKAHAEEMAKPSQINVRICSDYHEEWFAFACSWQGPRFNSEDEAIKWAVDNGYKVIK